MRLGARTDKTLTAVIENALLEKLARQKEAGHILYEMPIWRQWLLNQPVKGSAQIAIAAVFRA
jgi:hypothetical protein